MPLFDPDAPCVAIADALSEPLTGTAKVGAAWLVVEQPGSWGPRGLADVADWPDGLASELARRAEALGVAVQLVRRPGRHDRSGAPRSVWLAHLGEDGEQWLRHVTVADPAELDGLELAAALRASPDAAPGETWDEDLWLVCTHGRRDACCARLGRPVVAALSDAVAAGTVAGSVWETSHTGGHRFAANVVHLPSGTTYARVAPVRVAALAAQLQQGRLSLDAWRGNARHPRPVQAAEAFLRRALEMVGLDEVTHRGAVETWDGHRHVFTVTPTASRHDPANYHVEVEQRPTGTPRPLSDGDDELKDPGTWQLVRLERV